jgi:hypothetical protein
MSAPWPPPPDLASLQELVRAADPEGHLAEGAAADEYEPEEDAIFAAIHDLPTDRLTADFILPIIEQVWRNSFVHEEPALALSRPKLLELAKQIERFFGPEAQPKTRGVA